MKKSAAVTEAFVICEPHLATPKQQEESPEKCEGPPVRVYSDDFIAANARVVYRQFLLEPVYKAGKATGEWRVCRRRPDGRWDLAMNVPWQAIFSSIEEALEWGKSQTNAR